MVSFQVRLLNLIGIEGRKDFELDHKSMVIQMPTTEIARKVQHWNRILPKPEMAGEIKQPN